MYLQVITNSLQHGVRAQHGISWFDAHQLQSSSPHSASSPIFVSSSDKAWQLQTITLPSTSSLHQSCFDFTFQTPPKKRTMPSPSSFYQSCFDVTFPHSAQVTHDALSLGMARSPSRFQMPFPDHWTVVDPLYLLLAGTLGRSTFREPEAPGQLVASPSTTSNAQCPLPCHGRVTKFSIHFPDHWTDERRHCIHPFGRHL